MQRKGEHIKFRVPGFPFISLAGLFAIISILITTWFTPIFHATLVFGIPFILFLILMYSLHNYLRKKQGQTTYPH